MIELERCVILSGASRSFIARGAVEGSAVVSASAFAVACSLVVIPVEPALSEDVDTPISQPEVELPIANR
jgi:hypothetical protein